MDDINPADLPCPTTDLARCREDLEQYGYCLLADAIDAAILPRVQERLVEQAEAELAGGVATIAGAGIGNDYLGHAGARQLVRSLLNKGQDFRDLMALDPALDLFRFLLGKDMYCLSATGLIMRPGAEAQVIHTDQIYVPCQTPVPFVANVLFMVTPFTEANGATRVIPGSHRFDGVPPIRLQTGERGVTIKDNPMTFDTIPAEGPAGTAFIFDGRLWHGAGENRSEETRLALSIYYGRAFMRQQDLLPMNLTHEAYDAMTADQRALAGFGMQMNLGRIEPVFGRPATTEVYPVLGEMRP